MPFRRIKNCLETASAPWYAYPAFAYFSKKIKTLTQRTRFWIKPRGHGLLGFGTTKPHSLAPNSPNRNLNRNRNPGFAPFNLVQNLNSNLSFIWHAPGFEIMIKSTIKNYFGIATYGWGNNWTFA